MTCVNLRPLNIEPLFATDNEWFAHAFGGTVNYHVRRMSNGRFAPSINRLPHKSKETLQECVDMFNDDRITRIKMELDSDDTSN